MTHETDKACKQGCAVGDWQDSVVTWAAAAGSACACWAASGVACCWLLTDSPASARSAQLPRVVSSGASMLQQKGQTWMTGK